MITASSRPIVWVALLSTALASHASGNTISINKELHPVDGVYYDDAQPGYALVVQRVDVTRYFGAFLTYQQDGQPTWRNFVGTYEPRTGSDGSIGVAPIGTLTAPTHMVIGGAPLGATYQPPSSTLAPEGTIVIEFPTGVTAEVTYGDSFFRMHAPRASMTSRVGEGVNSGGDDTFSVTVLRRDDSETSKVEDGQVIGVAVPMGSDKIAYRLQLNNESPLLEAFGCSNVDHPDVPERVVIQLTLQPRVGRGSLDLAAEGTSVTSGGPFLGPAVATRDGWFAKGNTCDGATFMAKFREQTDLLR
jgi:hypothetical protein